MKQHDAIEELTQSFKFLRVKSFDEYVKGAHIDALKIEPKAATLIKSGYEELLRPCPSFDFRGLVENLAASEEMQEEEYTATWEMAKEMFFKGDFVLPFPSIWVEINETIAVKFLQVDENIHMFLYGRTVLFVDGGREEDVPSVSCYGMVYTEKGLLHSKNNCIRTLLFVQRVEGQGQEDLQEFLSSFFKLGTYSVMSIMSPGVEVEHEPAPVKLNRRRVERKRPRIADNYVVRIALCRPSHTDVEANPDGARTHASPIMHYRRAHYRNWAGRRIPVMHCLVGANGNSPMPDLGRRMYEVIKERVRSRRLGE